MPGAAGAITLGFLLSDSDPHPVIKYWVIMPIRLDTNQNSARPLGKLIVKKPNISGIIQVSMLFMDCCLGSELGIVDIFCSTHMLAATSMAMT